MTASYVIENKIAQIKPAKIFTVRDLGVPQEWWENTRVKLGRMVRAGLIAKLGRGKFYKPSTSVFGNIGPSQNEVIKDLLYKNGSPTGYVTGLSVWNQMGLTSQISNAIIIGTSLRRDNLTRGKYQVRFIMQPNKISINTIPLLQILDSLKFIKHIPDTSIIKSIRILKNHICELTEVKQSALARLSAPYPPRVRALLGVIFDTIGNHTLADKLKKSLNPSTTYSLGLSNSENFNFSDWNIK